MPFYMLHSLKYFYVTINAHKYKLFAFYLIDICGTLLWRKEVCINAECDGNGREASDTF